jgi:hypothetical protein
MGDRALAKDASSGVKASEREEGKGKTREMREKGRREILSIGCDHV